jgi:AraC family transcriptional regulator
MVQSPANEDCVLITALEGGTRMKARFNDHPPVDDVIVPGDFQIIPSYFVGQSLWDAPITAAFVRLPAQLVNSLAGEAFQGDPDRVRLIPRFDFKDPLLGALVAALCAEVRHVNPFGHLYVDSIARTIALHLLTHYSNASVRHQHSYKSLTSRQARAVDQYIQDHLDQRISLNELASLLFMSVGHFERVFRRTLGCAPYQYVLERRLERAKWLLETSVMSVYEVGRRCGFGNQSHFTRHFTRKYGISPARFRYSVTSRQLPR